MSSPTRRDCLKKPCYDIVKKALRNLAVEHSWLQDSRDEGKVVVEEEEEEGMAGWMEGHSHRE